MATELPKTYAPADIQPRIDQIWADEKCFAADPTAPGEPYSIVIPPPNVTGALHLGHAINNTLQDILTRMHRMAGYNTVWIPGIDHAGIATQAVVEKTIKEKEGLDRYSLAETPEKSREELIRRIWQWKQQYGDRIIQQLKLMGCSCDWDRTRFTLDDMCAKAVRETFFKLFKDGLIYRGKRLVNWDVHLQTSISDDEIYHEAVQTHLWHITYPIVDDGNQPRGTGLQPVLADSESSAATARSDQSYQHGLKARATMMVVATTRPETMLGDTAVAVHSEDPRWNWAIGKFVELPLTGRKIPIIADDVLVDPKFGSGVVKVTPAHDPNDYAVWQRHQNQPDQIDIIDLMNPDGTLNDNAGAKYKGLTLNKARHAVVNDLKEAGLLVKEEPYETNIGHSDRSKTRIETLRSDQWFVRMDYPGKSLAEPALQVVRDGTIQFFPERHAQQYLSWLGEKRDWPISRQLWWGHRIPVWTNIGVDAAEDPSPQSFEGAKVQAIINHPRSFVRNGERVAMRMDRGQLTDGREAWLYTYCVAPGNQEVEADLEKKGFVQDPDVLDTWFSSALWPHSTLGWPDQTAELTKWYPTSVLLTGRDIITLWVARMVMMGMYNMGDGAGERGTGVPPVSPAKDATPAAPASVATEHGRDGRATNVRALGVPFAHVAINPTILDGKGERMSKSKGNGVDPVDIIHSHGADAMRFTLATMATETQDVRMPVTKLPDGRNTSDKFDTGRNFCNKLWNAARFVLSNLESCQLPVASCQSEESSITNHQSPITLADRWILSRLSITVKEANEALKLYRFDQYAKACYDFFWRDLCDWYVEASKPAMKDPARAPQTANVLAAALDVSLRLMHPIIPYITEALWEKLNEVRPLESRTIPGKLDAKNAAGFSPGSPRSARLIHANWPLFDDKLASLVSDDAEHVFPRLQAIVGAIRNLRNEHKVDPRKSVTVTISAPGEEAVAVTQANREMIESLAVCTIKSVAANLPQPAGTMHVVVDGNCDVYVEGLVDVEAQAQLTEKKRGDLTKQIATLKARMANESYMAKAPPKLVEQTQQQLADAEAELAKLG